jgi:type 1 glutamine amidotransferase
MPGEAKLPVETPRFMKMHIALIVALLICTPICGAETSKPAHIVFMIGEDEYRTWETLPELAERDLKPAGFRVTIVHADSADKNHFPGLITALKEADLLFLSVRRRTPRHEELKAVRAFLESGKPLVGIRTASHAFAVRPKDKPPEAPYDLWQRFDPEVLGGNYNSHHGNGPQTTVALAPDAANHPILQGVNATSISSAGSLYKVSPLEPGATALLIGSVPDRPPEPVAWTHLYGPKRARVFYTSIGHVDDFKNPEYRRLLVNAVSWALGR